MLVQGRFQDSAAGGGSGSRVTLKVRGTYGPHDEGVFAWASTKLLHKGPYLCNHAMAHW